MPITMAPAIIRKPGVTPASRNRWTSSLTDPAVPKIPAGITMALTHAAAIRDYLDVENPAHLRYVQQDTGKASGKKQTFCNVYAHDAASLHGAYLPIVWWTSHGLKLLEAGSAPSAATDGAKPTATAINANSLYEWFVGQSSEFGWTSLTRAVDAQREADAGRFVVVIARAKKTGTGKRGAGHIAWIVQADTPVDSAADEASFVPTLSQAGAHNHKRSTERGRWWENGRYDAWGFWSHPGIG